ncbi:DNA mismatch repair protein MutS [Sphingorhabdus lutea]|uniref:DNA mismatch repair protein MutS n=1 Tax=Sphingorhabdus lutea TaxID=1913578 RepID=A0A1L3JE81_9SPHN|nr:DNA mismatch repair protein MutS [Sphingorhabdus lutea]APG63461.1 DNA mismatch repair protein MutS [Sphingorhabdus lutea]
MMVQYLELKAKAQDCLLFYRMGDFFELFFDDAKNAAEALDIALTSRGAHNGDPIPMCGVPVHSAEGYLARLIKAGFRVAIAEQTETPEQAKERGGSKALVTRDIVRYVTAGTLTEESLLDARSNNMIVALAFTADGMALAAADISTGYFELLEIESVDAAAQLARLGVKEVIMADGTDYDDKLAHILPHALQHVQVTHRPAAHFSSKAGEAAIKEYYGITTLDSFGGIGRSALAAAGGLLAYLAHVGQGKMPYLKAPYLFDDSAYMAIDQATRESLEIISTQDGQRKGSLLAEIDQSVTGAGARLLAQDLSLPLCQMEVINLRLELVNWFYDSGILRENIRAALKQIPDMARAMGRVVSGRASPRDLGQLRDGIGKSIMLKEQFGALDVRPKLLDQILPAFDGHGALYDILSRALIESPPTDSSNGGYIAAGYDAALDELRNISTNARRAIAALEQKYKEATGVTSLKIKHNAVLGYFVEVPAKHGDVLMQADSGFAHRQTMAGAVRFNSPELHEEAMQIISAGTHSIAAEAAHLEDLIAQILTRRDAIIALADALARIDVAQSHASKAALSNWTQPILRDDIYLDIIGGRHPVVEASLKGSKEQFVANDCGLFPEKRLWLVSGPNMGGKSTFLRQNALIILLAQAGAFVPAKSAEIGIVDRLFSRVGASDNLARGRSTFMVEMVETAAILTQATSKSFVILDEVGRGTSTYDGLAIAWAVVEAIHDMNQCRCLFATHYHELSRLSDRLGAMSLHHVRAKEWKGDLILLHELAEGPADRSYGIAVASLAGLPAPVVGRAKNVLDQLEEGRVATGGIAAGLGELPLFSAALDAAEAKVDRLREKLSDLDIDALSPREALDLLYELKQQAEQG